ncbi:MAG TPA: hypothetical protein VLK84_25490 [Longimicrobium sp.]|nr:hypothetical protein [Longimicrobium sp.]
MMRKLKLQLEELRVDTFATDATPLAAGTVLGATGANTCMTCVPYTGCRADNNTCYQTCQSCAGPSCDNVCNSAAGCVNYPDM